MIHLLKKHYEKISLALVALGVILHFAVTQIPYPADICFFIAVFVHSTKIWGVKRTSIYLVSAMVLGYSAEIFGINTGLLFGKYHYNINDVGIIYGVPLFIPIEYGYLLYVGNMLCLAISEKFSLKKHLLGLGLLTSVIMTLKDLSTDPIKSVVQQIWQWPNKGIYFGEPIHNFIGWVVVFSILTWVACYLAWHRGGYSEKISLKKEHFIMPLTLLFILGIFGFISALTVPKDMLSIGYVSAFMILIGYFPYLFLGCFQLKNR